MSTMPETTPLKFVILKQTDKKENEVTIHFIQYTGNEENVDALFKFIGDIDSDMYHDYADCGGDVNHYEYSRDLMSETTVDEMIINRFGC